MRIAVTSKSDIKRDAIEEVFGIKPDGYKVDDVMIPEQPIDIGNIRSGNYGARMRIESLMKSFDREKYDYVVSIENSIDITDWMDNIRGEDAKSKVIELANVVVYDIKNDRYYKSEFGVEVKGIDKYLRSGRSSGSYGDNNIWGYHKTIGSLIEIESKGCISGKNWIKEFATTFKGDRKLQLIEALKRLEEMGNMMKRSVNNNDDKSIISKKEFSKVINENLELFEDYPEKGIIFESLRKVFSEPVLMKYIGQRFYEEYKNIGIDMIAGMDSRGYILGTIASMYLNVGFTRIAKGGAKIPGGEDKIMYSIPITKEYSTPKGECFKVEIDSVKGKRVLIIDDLGATGGSMYTACKLIESAGGTVVGSVVLLQVRPLETLARTKLKRWNYNILTN